FMGRIDHNIDSSNRVFGTAYWNKRREDRYNWALGAANATGDGSINDFLVTQGFDYRSNLGLNAGYTNTISNALLFDLRVAFSRFGEDRDPAQTFDPAKLGFSQTALGMMQGFQYFP